MKTIIRKEDKEQLINSKEKKTYKIFASGGFHNSKETYVIVSQKAYDAFDDVERGLISSSEWIENYLSDNQKKRLENHFCGITGCTCGSYTRADFYKK